MGTDGEPDLEDAILERGFGLGLVDVFGKEDAAAESAPVAFLEELVLAVDAFLVAALAADGEQVVIDANLQGIRFDACDDRAYDQGRAAAEDVYGELPFIGGGEPVGRGGWGGGHGHMW